MCLSGGGSRRTYILRGFVRQLGRRNGRIVRGGHIGQIWIWITRWEDTVAARIP